MELAGVYVAYISSAKRLRLQRAVGLSRGLEARDCNPGLRRLDTIPMTIHGLMHAVKSIKMSILRVIYICFFGSPKASSDIVKHDMDDDI